MDKLDVAEERNSELENKVEEITWKAARHKDMENMAKNL